jgi:DNA-binding beta-propeller fold protein YncE
VTSLNLKFTRTIAFMLMCFFLFAAASFAATQPLAEPFGLALDAKGNLYVANLEAGQVLVFNPKYQQETGKTITNALRAPTGVAFDPNGNLYVSDLSYNTVNEYSPSGSLLQQLTSANGIGGPVAISIDGVGDLFVNNSFVNVTLISLPLDNQVLQSVSASSLGVNTVNGMATRGAIWALGTDQGFEPSRLDIFFLVGDTDHNPVAGTTGTAVAFDGSGNIYCANLDGTVDFYNATTKTSTLFKNVGYVSDGMVVDNARGRVYIANFQGNEIQVFSTQGELLATIK